MNSFILMAKIIRSPELRYTQDNQTPLATMLVEFQGRRSEDPASTLKAVGWGNLAKEIQEKYSEGDRVVLVGRLTMNVVDRQEGFKEKRAELVISQIYPVDSSVETATSSAKSDYSAPSASERTSHGSEGTSEPVSSDMRAFELSTPQNEPDQTPQEEPQATASSRSSHDAESNSVPVSSSNSEEKNLDDIPF